jgi:hypothetical protein
MLGQPGDNLPGGRDPLRYGLSVGIIACEIRSACEVRSRPVRLLAMLSVAVALAAPCLAQNVPALCTTQAMMTADARQSLADAALGLASAIKAGDTTRVQSMSAADIASKFDVTSYIVHTTASAIAGDTLRVTQLYRLDASARRAGDTSEADFGCALSGSADEVDFAIPGLPPGIYGFAMVEAEGQRPWLLSLLFEQQGSAWKMAGFYPHARSAAGHDGLWYWTTARADAKAGKKWLAWVLYGEADQLLRPANFVTSTHLDKLRNERRTSAPGELSEGISADNPLVVKGKDGSEFHFTALGSLVTDDGKGLDLVLRYRADSVADPTAARAKNIAAAAALLAAHPELREGVTGVSVFAEATGQPPFATELSLAEIHE